MDRPPINLNQPLIDSMAMVNQSSRACNVFLEQ